MEARRHVEFTGDSSPGDERRRWSPHRVQGGDGQISQEGLPAVLGSHPKFKEPTVQGTGEKAWAARQVGGEDGAMPGRSSEEVGNGYAGGQQGYGRRCYA